MTQLRWLWRWPVKLISSTRVSSGHECPKDSNKIRSGTNRHLSWKSYSRQPMPNSLANSQWKHLNRKQNLTRTSSMNCMVRWMIDPVYVGASILLRMLRMTTNSSWCLMICGPGRSGPYPVRLNQVPTQHNQRQWSKNTAFMCKMGTRLCRIGLLTRFWDVRQNSLLKLWTWSHHSKFPRSNWMD